MAVDEQDDAYFFRVARAVFDPAGDDMATVAKALKPPQEETVGAYRAAIKAFDAGCRAKNATAEEEALVAADKAITELVDLAADAKFDVRPREDINSFSAGVPVLYNKFLFRAG